MKKKPLSDREREALRNLREIFPAHEIYPNMRLADVIKADWRLFNSIKGYHVDFTICDGDGHVLAAVELDDSTHDSRRAQLRDAKKDGYLSDAGIKLIRIREISEIPDIPRKIEGYVFPARPAVTFMTDKRSRPESLAANYLVSGLISLIVVGLLWWGITTYVSSVSKTAISNIASRQQQFQQDALRRAQEQAAAQQAIVEKNGIVAPQPVYERRLIRGRSARECAGPGGVLDNVTVECMRDHYEMVLKVND